MRVNETGKWLLNERMSYTSSSLARFRETVWKHYSVHGRRTLPWRTTTRPYRILVSEVMLQQTQVERVIPYYRAWMKVFPTVEALARAPLGTVLRAWQGLGYNRRAKMLHEAAKAIVSRHRGVFPKNVAVLEALPGIGPYTARAVTAFAHNEDVVFVETNIRTAVIHHFFPKKKQVSDAEILVLLEKMLPNGRSREWYSALMDYGSYLKRSGIRLNARTKGYTKQSVFEGSARQARGALLRALVPGPQLRASLYTLLGPSRRVQLRTELTRLIREGMVEQNKNVVQLPR